ncbi:putative membrane protein YhjE [Paenibacillus sp. J31TS4]|uniref:TVP38/TMEM64 family protein n=1 Tax=Paenibacillus sp. J31TS4 TaxID=2807195 RepID=UPI001B04CF6E|nr:TVP38/TMEM64 family protein [Paenibacillus sp. J31TS4]GIP37013.1 putative membrane protein YhjE [Paenibacillus sp. J31TS4]
MKGMDKLAALNWQEIDNWLRQYEAWGPLPGIAALVLEAFLPFLPMVAIVIANVNAYGLGEGILVSWAGVVLGAVVVFALVRRFSGRLRSAIERKFRRSDKLIHWVETHGFTPIFLLACFPFTPSFLINVLAGISQVPFHTFVAATVLGKGVMISLVSLAGYDLASLLTHPWKLVLLGSVLGLLWLLGRKLESRYMK